MRNTRQLGEAVLYLSGCALRGVAPERETVEAMDLDALYSFAEWHKLAALCAWALERGGFGDGRSRAAVLSAQRRAMIFQHELELVQKGLQARGIWYLLLKGIVLQRLYPAYGLREMVDHDLLIDASRAEEIRSLMEGLGYSTASFGQSKHDVYLKAPCLNMQMHTSLFSPETGGRLYRFFQDAPRRLLGEGCEKHFSPEDFYLHLVAHAYGHYSAGGTGLRSLLDSYLYLQATPLDMDRVAAGTDAMGIRDFEERSRSLSCKLFDGGELSAEEEAMLDYICASGAHGTLEHAVDAQLRTDERSRVGYLLGRLFPPWRRAQAHYAAYAAAYPWFYRHRLRLLLLPFYRLWRAAKSGRLRAELRALRKARRQQPKP